MIFREMTINSIVPANDSEILREQLELIMNGHNFKIKGFIASVRKPRDLSVLGTGEKVGIRPLHKWQIKRKKYFDWLYVASWGKVLIRSKFILMSWMVMKIDRFTTAREGVKGDDPVYGEFIKSFQSTARRIIAKWEGLRYEFGERTR